MYDIITLGEILAEILTTEKNQALDKNGNLKGPFPSGAPAIMIDQAALMGVKTAIIAKVGDDPFGRMNIRQLKSDGVDISKIIIDKDNTTGVAFVTYYDDGNREFLYHFKHAACGKLSPDDLDFHAIKNSKYLHIMGCSITGSPELSKSILAATRFASENGVTISFDPNIRPELFTGKIKEIYQEILDKSQILLAGKSELNILYGGENKARDIYLSDANKILVVKDGSKSTRLYTASESFETATMKVKEIDPTGAGDCFDATFLAMLCRQASLKEAVQFANVAGALAVSKAGPMSGNSSFERINQLLKERGPLRCEKLQ